MYVTRYRKRLKVSNVIKSNTRKGCQSDKKQYWLDGVQIFIHGFQYRNDNNKLENLIIASFTSKTKVIEEYSKRWYIEVMLKNFKSNGFNIEDTHVTKTKRLEILIGLLTLGYLSVINAGKIILKEKPELFKMAKNERPKLSIFKTGLDQMLSVLLIVLTKRFNLIFKFLLYIYIHFIKSA